MSTMEIIWIVKRMDQLIRTRSTGSPVDFACRLGISARTLYNYLALMKDLGAPIRFSRWNNSYEYLENGRFRMEYDLSASENMLRNINL